MSQSRKHRGRETERLVAAHLRAHGFPYAEPVGSGTPGADITGTPSLAVEVKGRTRFDPAAWLRQAHSNADGRLPCVVMRLNGQGPASVDSFPVLLTFADFLTLLADAGHTTPLPKPIVTTTAALTHTTQTPRLTEREP
jgi:hypothetical protein